MFRSSLLVSLAALGASGLGFAVQLLLAKRFGLGREVDAYLFALSAPTVIAAILGAMLSYLVVPQLLSCKNDLEYQNRYINSVLASASGIGLALAAIGALGVAPFQGNLLPAGSLLSTGSEFGWLLVLCWMVGGAQILAAAVSAVLNAEQRYLTAATLALLPYAGTLAFLVGDATSIAGVPQGMLLGTFASVAAGLYVLRARLIWADPRTYFLGAEMRQLIRSTPYTALAMSCFSSYAVIDAYWAPRAGPGVLSNLGYAQRLIIAVGNLIVAGPSAVLVPKFGEYLRNDDRAGFMSFLGRSLTMVGAGALILAGALAYFAEDVVSVLFARGSFGPADVRSVARTLTYMAPGMVAMLLSVIALRALFCLPAAAKTGAVIGIGWFFCYFLVSAFLHTNGAAAIAVGYSVVWGLALVSIVLSVRSLALR